MPAMGDIASFSSPTASTVVTLTGVSPSGGDGSTAVWRANSLGASPALRPKLELTFRDNGDKTARKGYISFSFPYTYTDTNTGLTSVRAMIPFRTEVNIPNVVPDSVLDDAVNVWSWAMAADQLPVLSLIARVAPT